MTSQRKQKYHINSHGEPKPCNATKRKCRFGGETGEELHFEKLRDAQKYVEDNLKKDKGSFSNTTHKKPSPGQESAQAKKPPSPRRRASTKPKVPTVNGVNRNGIDYIDWANYDTLKLDSNVNKMIQDGRQIFESENGIILTREVLPEYITVI